MNVRIGAAPTSWGVEFPSDPRQIPWPRFLDEVAEAGYEWIELGPYGYLPTDPSTLRAELEQRGLKVAGAVAMGHLDESSAWPELEKQVMGAGELVAVLGAKYLVLIDGTYTDRHTGELTMPATLDETKWRRLIDATHAVADIVRDTFGLGLAFHPHAETHVEYEEQIVALLEQTDPNRVSLCLETGHQAYRRGDPIDFLRRFHGRVCYLHIKSVDARILRRVEAEHVPFVNAVEMGVFCEPSEGIVDFPGLKDLLQEINFDGWAIVEQDMSPARFDRPMAIARRTRAYLRDIGLG